MTPYKELLNSFIKGARFRIPKRQLSSNIGKLFRGRRKTTLDIKKAQAKIIYNLNDVYAILLGRIVGNS